VRLLGPFVVALVVAAPAVAKPVGGVECLQLLAVLPAAGLPEVRSQMQGVADPDAPDAPVAIVDAVKRLSSQGNGKALFSLAALEMSGYCVERDLGSALRHMTASAEAGDQSAQRFLAVNYERGKKVAITQSLGVDADPVQALMWFFILEAGKELQYAPKDIERLKASLTPEQVLSARTRADDWIAAHPAAMAEAIRPPR